MVDQSLDRLLLYKYMQNTHQRYMWTSDTMVVGVPYLQMQCNIQSKYGRLKSPRGCDQDEFSVSSLHDLIIVLDTLWGDMHEVLFIGKSKKLLFLAISTFRNFWRVV